MITKYLLCAGQSNEYSALNILFNSHNNAMMKVTGEETEAELSGNLSNIRELRIRNSKKSSLMSGAELLHCAVPLPIRECKGRKGGSSLPPSLILPSLLAF